MQKRWSRSRSGTLIVPEEATPMQIHAVYSEKIVQISANQVLRDVVFENCVLTANPASSITWVENVRCRNCIFLYDGMQVDDEEWLALIHRTPLVRGHA